VDYNLPLSLKIENYHSTVRTWDSANELCRCKKSRVWTKGHRLAEFLAIRVELCATNLDFAE